jgi:hypothetical protein
MSQGFTAGVYGQLNSQPPYVSDANGNLASVSATYAPANVQPANFPTTGINIWPIQPGVKMNGVFCYGVIEIPPSGLQQYSQKFIVKETVATLAILRG